MNKVVVIGKSAFSGQQGQVTAIKIVTLIQKTVMYEVKFDQPYGGIEGSVFYENELITNKPVTRACCGGYSQHAPSCPVL